jgi:surface antigen Omp85-like protein
MLSKPAPRPLSGSISACVLVMAAACDGVSAAEIRMVAPVEIVKPTEGRDDGPVLPASTLGKDLLRFLGSACNPEAIAEALARRYRFLGYVPSIAVTCDDGTLKATVRESSHTINLITFEPGELSRLGLVPDPEFEEKRGLYPVPQGATRAVLRGLLQTREGDLYNYERYRSENEALRRLGYIIAVIHADAPLEGTYPRAAYLVQSLVPRAAGGGGDRRKTNYLGGTASYAPRGHGLVGLLYQKDGLLGALDRLSLAPTYNASVGGDILYVAPLLSAQNDPERLYDLEIGIHSDFRHNRLLEGVETDERDSGLSTTLGIRPLALPAPHVLRFPLGVRYERVALEEAIPGVEEESVTSLQLGAEYEWLHTYRRPGLTARVAPLLEIAFDTAGGQRSFVRPSVDARLHGRFLAGFEIDVHLLGGTLDRQVPPFELWSLGGATTVRGFREDSFLGRHLGALQTELWIPLLREADYQPRGARLLKPALFLDGGYLSGTATGRNESIAGAGVGLRFLVPHRPLVVRFDYAWGLGGTGGESHPYVSISYHH